MDKTLGNKLNDLMIERKLTGKQLAADIGVTEGTISKILTGLNTNPKSDTIIALAKYFNVSADYLLGLSNYKTPQAADIGAITGLSEKSIEALNCQVKYFQAMQDTLEEEIDTPSNLTKEDADFSLDAIIGLNMRYDEILNQFVLGLLKEENIILQLGECRHMFDYIYKIADISENSQKAIEEEYLLILTQIIGADILYKKCTSKINALINKIVHYYPVKIQRITKQFIDITSNEKDNSVTDKFEKRVLQSMIKHKGSDILNGNSKKEG